MSYILDALRKADAERERDPARGIHAQPMAAQPVQRRPVPGLLWVVTALAVLVAAGAGYIWRERATEAARPPVPVALEGDRTSTAVPPAAHVIPVADAVEPPPPPVVQAPTVRLAPPSPRPAATASAGAGVKPLQLAKVSEAAHAAAPALAAASGTATPATPATTLKTPDVGAARIVPQAELPADVRSSLPKLAISGGVYSDNATQRMLIVGSQVVNEGAELAPGVVLEQIRPRDAVLRFRGWRYSVAY